MTVRKCRQCLMYFKGPVCQRCRARKEEAYELAWRKRRKPKR